MATRSFRRAGLCSAVALSLVFVADPASAQLVVYDPSNFSQNVLTAARELQQVNNQIQSLANEAQMLTNQARNLASLPLSTLSQLQTTIQKTQSLLAQAKHIAFDVQQIESAFATTYGSASNSASSSGLTATAQTRWRNSIAAFEDSLKVQAGVVGNISSNGSAMSSLTSASQTATGALQAAQAGNQLLALQSQQLSDLVAVVAAKSRADALEQSRITAAESQGQEQYRRFSTRSGYQPGNVSMFHGN
ncbi:P-type conjugative transfer protein TrbJ [Methylosinus sporium]|uniref:P-type conjugative transfer protein TrbJ n=1 Tax=Methylosinus sporium TaxID=428 RepID=UPI000D59763B|nr:P-type conjugative transfer protein TrbJ [Methylosinus sporium]PWB88696.1 P-type conjugative transfer protein TrbJ [Methylocystis sp. MitZ-2018]